MSEVIPANKLYRTKIAMAARDGSKVPSIETIAWGTDGTQNSEEQEELGGRVYSHAPDGREVDGPVLKITAVLHGEDVEGHQLREVGLIDSDGDLAGRRVFAPKELEAGTELETTIEIQY